MNTIKKVLKWGGIAVVAFIILAAIIGASSGKKSDTGQTVASQGGSESQVQEQVPASPDYTLSVKELSDEFDANAVSAKARYGGKLVQVTGITGSIDEDILGTPFVVVYDPSDTYQVSGVQCMFKRNDTDQLLSLSKGSSVTVQGVVSDEVILHVMMRECEVVE